jgi:hypothetical protein
VYFVTAMTAWIPMRAHAEPVEDTMARYESIARDAAMVAYDDAEQPLFDGPDGRARTALLMLSIASFESSYQHAVDIGAGRGDHGTSYCLMQIRVGEGTTREGWTGRQLVTDRTKCFRAALHILHGSFNVCHNLPMEDRMSAYATGRCLENTRASRVRVGRAQAWWSAHAPPADAASRDAVPAADATSHDG